MARPAFFSFTFYPIDDVNDMKAYILEEFGANLYLLAKHHDHYHLVVHNRNNHRDHRNGTPILNDQGQTAVVATDVPFFKKHGLDIVYRCTTLDKELILVEVRRICCLFDNVEVLHADDHFESLVLYVRLHDTPF